ncbi:MAG: pyridoxal-phosphate dependent enzyme [Rhodospirillales bacterium]|nr:pyridoxal-phosphate dependent enzyme [Rhodospirillales bacterium]
MQTTYLDPRSGRTYPLDPPRWCGDDGAPLFLTDLAGIAPADIDTKAQGLWRYRAALPLPDASPVTLGEGWTPLLERRFAGIDVRVKCEWVMPTGSFKDRGAAVMLTGLSAQGVTDVLEDSSGNGGAAVAAYAAVAGMAATILAPESTSPAKTLAMRAAGARVELIPGNRQATADAAVARSRSIFYASHNWHPFFLHGTKTLAYELWEQLDFRAPDNVIIPCGAGSNVLGCAIGFGELLRAGQIKRLPRLFAAQPRHCAPIAAAAAGEAPPPVQPTIAEGTAIAQPVRLREVVGALRDSGGGGVMVEEDAIAAATLALARNGLYVEPTCAQALPALETLLAEGRIRPGETTVMVLTGSGLKAGPRIEEILRRFP